MRKRCLTTASMPKFLKTSRVFSPLKNRSLSRGNEIKNLRTHRGVEQTSYGSDKQTSITEKQPQDELWESNYLLKLKINEINVENKSLRAKVWNMEKASRQMIRQLSVWGMIKYVDNKPFIDSSTLEQVFQEKHYQQHTLKQITLQKVEELDKKVQEESQLKKLIELDYSKNDDFLKQMNVGLLDALKTYVTTLKQNKKITDVSIQLNKTFETLWQKKLSLFEKIEKIEGLNKVQEFQIEVQGRCCINVNSFNRQKNLEIEDQLNRLNNLNKTYHKMEKDINTKAPYIAIKALDTRKAATKRHYKNIKSVDEILAEKAQLIDEYQQKIESLKFQSQELARSYILERQNVIKEISQAREENELLQQMLLAYRTCIIKHQTQKKLSQNKHGKQLTSNFDSMD